MTIEKLLLMKVESVSTDIYDIHSHLWNEIDCTFLEKPNEKIEIRYYKNHNFDGRRIWQLASVWFENKPFMIVQSAGREGRDHRERFIFNRNVFEDAISYIRTLQENEEIPLFTIREEIPELTQFNGYALELFENEH